MKKIRPSCGVLYLERPELYADEMPQVSGKKAGKLHGYVDRVPKQTKGPRHQKPRRKKP